MPITKLTALAKEKHAVVLIDGAHAPGMEDIDVTAIGADLYTGNCHKWLFAPKGTAFLWTKRSVQSEDFPLPCVMSSTGKLDYVGKHCVCEKCSHCAYLLFALRFPQQSAISLFTHPICTN